MLLNYYSKEEDKNKEESINRYKNIFLNYDKNMSIISEALIQKYKSLDALNDKKINEFIDDIVNKCKERMDSDFDILKFKYNNITKEDTYIICYYTCESEYRTILNKNLVSIDRKNVVRNVSKYLYIFLKALRKLLRY